MMLSVSLVGGFPQPDWLIDRAALLRTACRACAQRRSGAFLGG